MKLFFLTCFVCLFSLCLHAQEWQPVIATDTAYFAVQVPSGGIDSEFNGYVTALRVTGISYQGTRKILQFPYSMRKDENEIMDAVTGNSWLGHSCVWDTISGECIFRNQYLDTIRIWTLAQINDSWIVSTDTNGVDYYGTVSAIIPQMIDNQNDSVKIITIQAFSGITPVSNYYNGFTVQLSKEHGFYVLPDLYAFPNYDSMEIYTYGIPYRKVQRDHKRIDYDKTMINAALINFPEKYQSGNEWIKVTRDDYFIPMMGFFHDSVLSWTPVSASTILANLKKHNLWDSVTNIPPQYFTENQFYGSSSDSIFQDTVIKAILRLYNPEPITFYNPNMQPSNNFHWVFFSETCGGLIEIRDSLCYETPLSGNTHNSNGYLENFGRVSLHRQSDGGSSSYNHDEKMAYIKMGSCLIGNNFWFAPNATNDLYRDSSDIVVYPNPSSNELFLRMPNDMQCSQVNLKRVDGISIRSIYSPRYPIDISNLSPGSYLIELITNKGRWTRNITKK